MKWPQCAAERARQGEIQETRYLRMRYILLFFTAFSIISLLIRAEGCALLVALPPAAPLEAESSSEQAHTMSFPHF